MFFVLRFAPPACCARRLVVLLASRPGFLFGSLAAARPGFVLCPAPRCFRRFASSIPAARARWPVPASPVLPSRFASCFSGAAPRALLFFRLCLVPPWGSPAAGGQVPGTVLFLVPGLFLVVRGCAPSPPPAEQMSSTSSSPSFVVLMFLSGASPLSVVSPAEQMPSAFPPPGVLSFDAWSVPVHDVFLEGLRPGVLFLLRWITFPSRLRRPLVFRLVVLSASQCVSQGASPRPVGSSVVACSTGACACGGRFPVRLPSRFTQ